MSATAAALAVVLLGVVARRRVHGPPRIVGSQHFVAPRRLAHSAQQWACLLDAIAAEVRTGTSLVAALAHATAQSGVRGHIVQPGCTLARIRSGDTSDPDEALVVHAITSAHSLGGQVAATLDGAAAVLRERCTVRAEALAHSAQARLSARVLTAVPVAFAGWSLATSRSIRIALLTPAGVICALIGGLFNAAGWWWMRRIVSRAAK